MVFEASYPPIQVDMAGPAWESGVPAAERLQGLFRSFYACGVLVKVTPGHALSKLADAKPNLSYEAVFEQNGGQRVSAWGAGNTPLPTPIGLSGVPVEKKCLFLRQIRLWGTPGNWEVTVTLICLSKARYAELWATEETGVAPARQFQLFVWDA